MAPSRDEIQLRRMLEDLTADQPPAPPDRCRAVRHRASRNRWSRAGGIILALALALTGVGVGISWPASDAGRGPVATGRDGAMIRTPLAGLTGSDTAVGDGFGASLAISGGTIVVGAPGHDRSAGRVYVFTQAAGGWRQSAELTGFDTAVGDGFGASLAISGGTIVVGAPGHDRSAGRVYVFTQAVGGWRQSAELTGFDTMAGDGFGSSVAISGGTIVVGAVGRGFSGRAYAFSATAGSWSPAAEMKGFRDPYAPVAVAVSGATIVVSSQIGQQPNVTWTSIYVKTAGAWKRAAQLYPSGPGLFVRAVMSATTIVITSQGPGCGTGQADVYTRTGHGWNQVATLPPGGPGSGCFGGSVAISGSSVVVATAPSSVVYVFTRTADGWRQSAELTRSRSAASDDYTYAVAISGRTVVVGAVSGTSGKSLGRVYVYRL